MNILSIGNSFSRDAHTYFSRIAELEGEQILAANLYIGGCSLEKHFRNMMGDKRIVELDICGHSGTGFVVSIKEALLANHWDVVTLQQQSSAAADYATYQPYLNELAACVRKYSPGSKIYLHETWGYENEGTLLASTPYSSMREMSEHIFDAYAKAAKEIGADGIIPSGHAMLAYSEAGKKAHRADGFHAGHGAPHYMLGCVWYEALFGKPVTKEFTEFHVETSAEDAALARECAHKAFL